MKKNYTEKDYADMAAIATTQGKKLIPVQEEAEKPIKVFEYEKKTIEVPVCDENCNITGYENAEVDDFEKPIMIDVVDDEGNTYKQHKYHTDTITEIVERLEIVDNPENFARNFFKTSLGYISRIVHNKNGVTENFLNDTLPALSVGVPIITYNIDGTQNKNVTVTQEFLDECKQQKFKDFYG